MEMKTIRIPHPKAALQFFRNAGDARFMRREAIRQKVKTQHMVDIISGTEDEDIGAYKGNEYRTYRKAVSAINRKYNGTAKWGVLQTGNIIDLRAAFIISRGIKVMAREEVVDATKEIKWANDFLEYNDLDKEMVQEFAKEAEIEGKILLKIDVDDTPEIEKYKEYGYQMIAARYVSWTDKKYTVKTPDDDYGKFIRVEWESGSGGPGSLEEAQFVYKKFGGRINEPNSAQSKVMKCLSQIDNLDKALRDWREIDRIFGGPILYMKCETKQEADAALDMFKDKNFKIKRVTAGTGELMFVELSMSGVESLEKEILTNAKMISGTTGVGVQYMGLIELLKNRSTGDDMREGLSSATTKERATWEGAYEELITKAMNLFNNTVKKQKSENTKLNPSLIKVVIPTITKQQWDNIEKIWLPAVVAGKITQKLFLEKLPDVDVEEELERQKENEESELERVRTENENLKKEQPFMGEEE